jgi:hypothetical protein
LVADAERVKAEFEEKLQATEREKDSAKELVSGIKKVGGEELVVGVEYSTNMSAA